MKRNVMLLLWSLITNLLSAQSNPFVKAYMVRADPIYTAHNFRQTADKGFILASDHILSGPDSAGITTYGYLVKLDAAGQPTWTIRYPKIPCYYPPNDADAVTQAADGGYAIATSLYYCTGNYQGYGVIWLIKTDTAGTVSWSRSFSCKGISIVNCVQPTSDRGFILAGMTKDTLTHVESYLMIKTDSMGQAQWQKTYHSHDSSSVYGAFNSVIQTHDGGYVACGQGLAPCNYGSVMRMDANGDIIWSRKPQGELSRFTDVQETNDHHYIISGLGPDQNNLLVHRMYKMDDWGNTTWAQELISFPSQDRLSSVVVEDDGYTFAGCTDTGFQQSAIIHTDTSGNVMWYHTFPQNYPTISPSIALADSGYAYNTTCQTNGSNGWFIGLGVIKTDQQGWTTCAMQAPSYIVNAIPRLDTLDIIAVDENFPINTPDLVSQVVNLNDTTYCSFTGITETQPSSSNLVLYPNPTNGNAYLQLPQDGRKYRVTMYNELGQLLNIALQTTGFTVELPTSTLAPGIYVIRAINEDGIAQHIRLVKTE